jgi:hypothetical protein
MTRTLTDNGDSYLTEQMTCKTYNVQYVDYGSVKGDPKHPPHLRDDRLRQVRLFHQRPARDRHLVAPDRPKTTPAICWTTGPSSRSNRAIPGSPCTRRTAL